MCAFRHEINSASLSQKEQAHVSYFMSAFSHEINSACLSQKEQVHVSYL